ncbi:MAG: MBL fold metallo-hydrolase [Deltaproteobacteria bacterium]|nr:MBL fold metallo-hydrolase [Deltaproteobacteria bacterium]
MRRNYFLVFIFTFVFISGWSLAWGQNVKITPLGTHDGESCRRDRAFLFEDPNGTTLLYDAGRSVLGSGDARLPAKLDVVLLSSVHSDHIGDRIPAKMNAGTCKKPKMSVSTKPNSNTAEIAAKKKSKVVVGGQMRGFLRKKVIAAGGSKKQMKLLRFGGKRTIGGVKIAIIPTVHANGVSPAFLNKAMADAMKPDGLTAYVGPDNGYILTFTNGLVVYLSADTGHTSDMETIVRRYYKANLAIINIGDIFTMGPEEAAWAINELIKPKAAIPTHANEATKGGKVQPKSKTAKFMKLVKGIPVHVPLSGRTMEFDGNAKCVSGC